jgi:hypothetical protein
LKQLIMIKCKQGVKLHMVIETGDRARSHSS